MNFSMKYSMAVAKRTASLCRNTNSFRRVNEASAKTFTSKASLPFCVSRDLLLLLYGNEKLNICI